MSAEMWVDPVEYGLVEELLLYPLVQEESMWMQGGPRASQDEEDLTLLC